MARVILLAAMGALCGCLAAPGGSDPSGDGSSTDAPPTADGTSGADASPAIDCDSAFAVAYTDRVTARAAGGEFVGMLVIEALGDDVELDDLIEGPDDSFQVELELAEPAYGLMTPGTARGALDPEVEARFLAAELIEAEAWDGTAPTFKLNFTEVGSLEPPHEFEAIVRVADSVATLPFDIAYDSVQTAIGTVRGVTRVTSVCEE